MRVNEHIDFRSDSELTSIMFFLMAAICKATKGKALKNTEISKDEPLNAKKELKENSKREQLIDCRTSKMRNNRY